MVKRLGKQQITTPPSASAPETRTVIGAARIYPVNIGVTEEATYNQHTKPTNISYQQTNKTQPNNSGKTNQSNNKQDNQPTNKTINQPTKQMKKRRENNASHRSPRLFRRSIDNVIPWLEEIEYKHREKARGTGHKDKNISTTIIEKRGVG